MPNNPFEPMIKNIGDYVSGTLYAQGVIPPIGIDNYEGFALSSPADTHLLAAKDPVIDEIAVGMTGNEINADFVTGTPPLTLSDSEGYPLQWWQVNLSPYQEGTGDPAPDNVRPIYGTDKVTMWTAGVNLLNPANVLNGYLTGTGVFTATTTGEKTFFAYLPAGQYTYSKPLQTTRTRYCLFDTMPVNGAQGSIVSTGNWDNYHCSTTLTKPCYFVAWNYNNTGETYSIDEILATTSINIGMTSLPYEPYVGSSSVITLPETIYSGEVFAGGAVSRWGEVDLGTLEWVYNTQNSTFYALVAGKAYGQSDRRIMCEQYKPSSTTGFNLSDYEISVGSSNSYVYVKDPRYSTASDFKTAVSGGKLVYPLETPIIFTLTTPSIPTPTGNATTWATAEDGVVDSMEVTYVAKA